MSSDAQRGFCMVRNLREARQMGTWTSFCEVV